MATPLLYKLRHARTATPPTTVKTRGWVARATGARSETCFADESDENTPKTILILFLNTFKEQISHPLHTN